MNNKKWIKIWTIILIIIPIVGGFNYLIDPLSINGNQLLDLKKTVQSVRSEKVIAVKSLDNIDNLILGSSRSMRINPEDVNNFLNGDTFNFSVNSALPEDYYGILLYLEKIDKVPKNIIIGFDFYILNDKLNYDDRFISNKELNFIDVLNTDVLNIKNNLLDKYLNFDTLKLSIKTIYHNIIRTEQASKFDTNGFLYWARQDDLIKKGGYKYFTRIKSDSSQYFVNKYSRERYDKFSNERVEYLNNIKDFAKKHNITLYTYLTPVHCYHLAKIKNHKLLGNTLKRFKLLLSSKFNYVDFMTHNKVNCKDEFYYDAVHQSYYINKLIVNDLFTDFPTYGISSNE